MLAKKQVRNSCSKLEHELLGSDKESKESRYKSIKAKQEMGDVRK